METAFSSEEQAPARKKPRLMIYDPPKGAWTFQILDRLIPGYVTYERYLIAAESVLEDEFRAPLDGHGAPLERLIAFMVSQNVASHLNIHMTTKEARCFGTSYSKLCDFQIFDAHDVERVLMSNAMASRMVEACVRYNYRLALIRDLMQNFERTRCVDEDLELAERIVDNYLRAVSNIDLKFKETGRTFDLNQYHINWSLGKKNDAALDSKNSVPVKTKISKEEREEMILHPAPDPRVEADIRRRMQAVQDADAARGHRIIMFHQKIVAASQA